MKISNALEGYFMAKRAEGMAQATMAIYGVMFDHLIAFLGDKEIDAVTQAELREFLAWLREDYVNKNTGGNVSSSYVSNAWKAIRSFYNWVEEEFEINRPDRNLKMPKHRSKLIEPFTDEDIKAMVAACKYSRTYIVPGKEAFRTLNKGYRRNIALIMFLLDTGVRAGELERLNLGDVDIDTGEATIHPFGRGMKSRPRHVFFGRQTQIALWHTLDERKDKSPESPLFVSGIKQKRLNRSTLRSVLRRLGDRAGVDGVHPHRFRHTFAIHYLRNGGDVFTLQRLLGHSSLDMVKNYLAIADRDAKDAHKKASPTDRIFKE